MRVDEFSECDLFQADAPEKKGVQARLTNHKIFNIKSIFPEGSA
jgi:hypothetical protein